MEIKQLILWAVIFIVSVIAELATMQLVSVWFAVGALAAFIAAFFLPFWLQVAVFSTVSVLFFIASRPLIKKLMVKTTPTNLDKEIGSRALVIEAIDDKNKTGRIRLNGVDWNAYTIDGSLIEKDEPVIVKQISGTKILVEKCSLLEDSEEQDLWKKYNQ